MDITVEVPVGSVTTRQMPTKRNIPPSRIEGAFELRTELLCEHTTIPVAYHAQVGGSEKVLGKTTKWRITGYFKSRDGMINIQLEPCSPKTRVDIMKFMVLRDPANRCNFIIKGVSPERVNKQGQERRKEAMLASRRGRCALHEAAL